MEYRYIKNLCDNKAIKSKDLSTLQKKKPTFKDKAKFRAWCADKNTDHCFYSTVIGDTPSLRVSSSNPPHTVWGVVADYDAPIDFSIIDKILATQCKSAMPTWRSKTQSGYLRLVWEFESGITVAPDLFAEFMKRMANYLALDRICAGFDKSSLKASQYFELGVDWTKVGDPLDESIYQSAYRKAAMDKPPQVSEVSIPIDVIAEEVNKRFPNRWEGEFNIGSRGPLFWIDDGIEREGCQVSDNGMVTYSDRAGKGFVSWTEIFGKKFVSDYETTKTSGILDTYWYNGKTYFKLIYGAAQQIQEKQLILELRQAGFSPKIRAGKACSEVENALVSICNDNRIDEIAPVIFSKDRVVTYNSRRILNNANINPVKPADSGDKKDWPFIHKWLSSLFVNNSKTPTIDYFYAWLQRFYISVIDKNAAQGQALLLVGPTNKGKSLLSNCVISALVGGFADASEYISGGTSFNKDLGGKAAWVIDDTVSAASFQDQRKATELIKKAVANPRMEYHAKHVDAISVPWTGRVIMSLNMDPNSLSVIPALDSSNRDKIMALLISETSRSKFPPNHILEQTIKDELPYFAKFLIDFKPPKSVLGTSRFGVDSYIDPVIASAAYDNSSRSSIAELVEFFVKRAREYGHSVSWRGTLTDFQVTVQDFNGGRNVGMSGSMEFLRRGIGIMEDAARNNSHLRPIKSRGQGGGKIWEIDLDEKYDIDNIQNDKIIAVL